MVRLYCDSSALQGRIVCEFAEGATAAVLQGTCGVSRRHTPSACTMAAPACTVQENVPTLEIENTSKGWWWTRFRKPTPSTKITLQNASKFFVRYEVVHLNAPHVEERSSSQMTVLSGSVGTSTMPSAQVSAKSVRRKNKSVKYRDRRLANAYFLPRSTALPGGQQEVFFPSKGCRLLVRGYLQLPSTGDDEEYKQFKAKEYTERNSNLILTAMDSRLDAAVGPARAAAESATVLEQETTNRTTIELGTLIVILTILLGPVVAYYLGSSLWSAAF